MKPPVDPSIMYASPPPLKVDMKDLINEVFDMVKPAEPERITLKDLIKCGQGDIIVSILIDVNGFWTYEYREALVAAENINNR